VPDADAFIQEWDFKGLGPLKSFIDHPDSEGAWINSGFAKGWPFSRFAKGETLGNAHQRLS
jgi:hypothetical protein